MMRRLHFCFITLASIICLMACNTRDNRKQPEKNKMAITDSIGIKFEIVTNAIEVPVELNVSPDNTHRMFITDNSGKLWILKNDSLLSKPFFNIFNKLGKPDKASLLGSIFSVAFHPQFSKNRKFYVCYIAPPQLIQNAVNW